MVRFAPVDLELEVHQGYAAAGRARSPHVAPAPCPNIKCACEAGVSYMDVHGNSPRVAVA
jgi:hypothetical protein